MLKENVVYLNNGIWLSFKKEGNSVICDMNEPRDITLSEISQEQKDKYCLN